MPALRFPPPAMRRLLALGLLLSVLNSLPAQGWKYPPRFEGARAEVYKQVGDVALSLHIFEPASGPNTNRPAIVFFFGGGWTNGSPAQFEPHCRHLSARGLVAIVADYRVSSRHQVKPTACVADAKSAIRWLRQNAARLGLDPQRIAAGGGSAGGHLAASTATLPDFDEPGENLEISSKPDALVLFNPALVLTPMKGLELRHFFTSHGAKRLGTDPKRLSPAHHVKPGTPPAIIFHGEADTTVPYSTAEVFTRVMKAAGNRCELVGYPDQPHGFFNRGFANGRYEETLAAADAFLVSLGWLPAKSG